MTRLLERHGANQTSAVSRIRFKCVVGALSQKMSTKIRFEKLFLDKIGEVELKVCPATDQMFA